MNSTDPGNAPCGVTVIITTYNYAGVLSAAINSVLAQDHPLVETIVVDDGSTDHTSDVIAGFGDRVRYIYQPNTGLSAARNTGIRAARHAFVAFLDADDVWLPGMLSALMRAFSCLPPEFGLVACSSKKVRISGHQVVKATLTTPSAREVSREELILMNRFASDAVVVRQGVLEKCGYFDTTLTSSEDRDLWIRLAEHSRIYFLPDLLVTVHVHTDSMSHNPDRMKFNMSKVLFQVRQRCRRMTRFSPFFWAKVRAFYHYQVAWMYMNAGRPLIACREMFLSLLCWPLFLHPGELRENCCFRIRSLLYFSTWKLRRFS